MLLEYIFYHQDENLQVILNHHCHNEGVYGARNKRYRYQFRIHLMCESLEVNRKFTYGKNS